ncbi:hypothetical protein, partial [Trichormus variabilis]
STNSKIIASGSDDNTIQIFHLSSQKFNNKISINKNTSKNNLITLYYYFIYAMLTILLLIWIFL